MTGTTIVIYDNSQLQSIIVQCLVWIFFVELVAFLGGICHQYRGVLAWKARNRCLELEYVIILPPQEEEESTTEEEERLCCICLNEVPATRLEPCGHEVLCLSCCIRAMDHFGRKCPICRSYTTRVRHWTPSPSLLVDKQAVAFLTAFLALIP